MHQVFVFRDKREGHDLICSLHFRQSHVLYCQDDLVWLKEEYEVR